MGKCRAVIGPIWPSPLKVRYPVASSASKTGAEKMRLYRCIWLQIVTGIIPEKEDFFMLLADAKHTFLNRYSHNISG
jgi:hypothetical protein